MVGFGIATGWSALVCSVAMWAVMFLAYKSSNVLEDKDPNQFVNWLLAIAAAFAVLSVFPSTQLMFGGWYNEPLAISNLPHYLLPLPSRLERAIGAAGYLGIVFALLKTLRLLERRPRFTLLFILNPTVLLVLFGHNGVFVLFMCAAWAFWFLIKGGWWIAFAFLGLSFGFGILGLALVGIFLKHLISRTAREQWPRQLALAVVAYCACASLVMLPYGPQKVLSILVLPWTGSIGMVGILLGLAILVTIAFLYRAELSGKDTALFASLFVMTLLVVTGLAISITPFILLLVAAIPFRSAPQLWLTFAIGVIALLPNVHSTDALVIAAISVFVILMILQSRHAWKETGLFTTIDVR